MGVVMAVEDSVAVMAVVVMVAADLVVVMVAAVRAGARDACLL